MAEERQVSVGEPVLRLTFSVLIPAYNAANTIGRAIDSVLSQTRRPEEVIVCNDGSTDATRDILARYGGEVRVHQQPNGGLSVARNAILRMARSEFVILLDADDAWLPDRIAKLEQHLLANPQLDIVTSDAWIVRDGVRTGTWYARRSFPREDRQQVEILRDNFVFASAAVRRESLLAVGGWNADVPHQMEYEGWIRMVLSGSRVGLVAEPLALYVTSPNGLSTNRSGTHSTMLLVLREIEESYALGMEQREALNEQRRKRVRLLRNAEAVCALAQRKASTRKKCLAAAAAPGQRPARRAKFVLAAVAPGIARRLVPRRL